MMFPIALFGTPALVFGLGIAYTLAVRKARKLLGRVP